MEEERSLTEEELGHKKTAKENYSKWVSMEEVHWRQRIGTRGFSTVCNEENIVCRRVSTRFFLQKYRPDDFSG